MWLNRPKAGSLHPSQQLGLRSKNLKPSLELVHFHFELLTTDTSVFWVSSAFSHLLRGLFGIQTSRLSISVKEAASQKLFPNSGGTSGANNSKWRFSYPPNFPVTPKANKYPATNPRHINYFHPSTNSYYP